MAKSKRRQILDRVNKRISSIVSHTGMDIDILHDLAQTIDHVYVTDKDRINIDEDEYYDDLGTQLDKIIKTYSTFKEDAIDRISKQSTQPEDMTKAINQEIRDRLKLEKEMDDFWGEHYAELTNSIDEAEIKGLMNSWIDRENAKRSLRDLGTEYQKGELTSTQLLNILEQVHDIENMYQGGRY